MEIAIAIALDTLSGELQNQKPEFECMRDNSIFRKKKAKGEYERAFENSLEMLKIKQGLIM